MKIKVTIDYSNGCYNVIGFHKGEGKNRSINKDITSYSYNSGIICEKNYNRFAIRERNYKIRRDINKIIKQDPNFIISEYALTKVDTLLYQALEDWDHLLGNNTHYANEFLKIIIKDYTTESHSEILSRKSRKKCMIERANALKRAGIDITYNVGLFNTDKKLTPIDKIKGIIIAEKQKRFIGAKVINNIIVKEAIYKKDRLLNFENETDVENSKEKNKSEKSSKSKIKINLPKKLYRKVSNVKDFIKNKKFISKKFKKIVIRGIATTLAIGGITTAAKIGGTLFRSSNNNDNKTTKYETEFNTDNIHIFEDEDESETITESETQSETEKTTESETQSETEKATESEAQSETEKTTESEAQSETEKTTESEAQSETEKTTESETEKAAKSDAKSKNKNSKSENSKKIIKKKVKKFKKYAIQKYKDSFIIGEKPNVGNLLINEKYGENPDGSGNKGKFLTHPDYQVDHILIMTNNEWYTIKTEGKSLLQVLKEYPDRTGYSIHFSNSETNGGLGFITQSQLEELIEKKVDNMIENAKTKNSKQIYNNEFIR